MHIRILPAIALTALLPPASPAAAQDPGPSLEDVFTVAAPGGLRLSPDGSQLLYTLRTAELEENETDTEIWRIALDGDGDPVRLTRNDGSDRRPRWRPGARTFAFLSARSDDEATALYRMSPFGGEPEELYAHPTSIRAFEWSPDGRRIAFTARDAETEAEAKRKERGRDVRVQGDPGAHTHLWVLDVESGEARRRTEGRGLTVGAFDWSPDGERIAFSAAPTPRVTDSWKTDVYVVAAADSAAPRRLTSNPGPDADPVWTPDGRRIVYQGRPTGEYRVGQSRVYRIPAEGGEPEDVSPNADLDPSRYVFTPDGAAVFFRATTGTTRGVFYMPLSTREPVRISPDRGVWTAASFSADRRRVAVVHEAPERPAEVYRAALPAAPDRRALAGAERITGHNEHAAGWAVGRTEVLRWRSADGREVEGLVVYPAGWAPGDGPRPLIVKIHGGPSGVYVQNFQASSYGSIAQLYAADGYAMLLPNPRGSSGYGDAGQRAVIEDWGGRDFEDITAGVDTLVARGVAHPDSLGVMGWSYGGYMTAWAVTQTDRFRAAVVGAGITETVAMWGTHDILHVYEAYFGGSPYDDGQWSEYRESSPLAFVRDASTPTLIIHGAGDERVPPNQAMIFYRALRANDVPTELVWLPRTGHGPREPGLQYETARRQKAWFDRWIRGESGTPATQEQP